MLTHRLFSYTLAASAVAAGAQVALPEGGARLLDTAMVSTSTSPLDHVRGPHRVTAANHIAGRAFHQANRPFVSVI